jgi:hypothetical protein
MTAANGRFTLAHCMTRKLVGETWHIGCRARPRSEWQNLTACERSMMAHNQDWLEWLLSLNANGAEYVIVGGVALALTDFRVTRVTSMFSFMPHRRMLRASCKRSKISGSNR